MRTSEVHVGIDFTPVQISPTQISGRDYQFSSELSDVLNQAMHMGIVRGRTRLFQREAICWLKLLKIVSYGV